MFARRLRWPDPVAASPTWHTIPQGYESVPAPLLGTLNLWPPHWANSVPDSETGSNPTILCAEENIRLLQVLHVWPGVYYGGPWRESVSRTRVRRKPHFLAFIWLICPILERRGRHVPKQQLSIFHWPPLTGITEPIKQECQPLSMLWRVVTFLP